LREPSAFVDRQRLLDRETEQVRRGEAGLSDQVFFDYGGWYSFYLFIFDDGVNSSRTFRRHDLRLWTRFKLDGGAHEFYARGRISFLDFNSGDSFDGRDDDVEGMNLERGYYRFDLSRAARAYGWAEPGYNVTVEAGRDLVEMGTGLTLSVPLDHVAVGVSRGAWKVRGIVGQTVGSIQDLDLTRPTTRTRRAIFGTELTYTGWERHEPFVYAMWQRDHNRNGYPSPLQRFDYDSFYVGIGSTGEIVEHLGYLAEWAYESGRSFGDRRFLRSDVIRAWAMDAQLEYLFLGARKGRVSAEYLFSSGDADRRFSPTDAIGGNRRGHTDSSFVGLGYRDTGLALTPRLSNLHLWRAGASVYPWPGDRRLSKLQVGTNWFLYYKNQRSGAISDPTAGVPSGYVGWAMDYAVNWEVASDLVWTVRLGAFFPGRAFADRTTRTFFLTGVTWSF